MGHLVILGTMSFELWSLSLNVCDPDTRHERAVPLRAAHAFTALLFEHADLRPARLAVDDAEHFGAAHKRRTGHHFAAVFGEEQNLLEGDLLAGLGRAPIEFDNCAWRYLHLPTTGLNNRVHGGT